MMPYNPYAMNPYIMQQQQPDIGGLSPVFQNIGQQQATQNAALAQQNQLVNQASQVGGSGSGMNPMMMAAMLRKDQGTNPYLGAAKAMLQYGPENVYGYGGQGQVPTTTTGMD
jgi:hypothetical protein